MYNDTIKPRNIINKKYGKRYKKRPTHEEQAFLLVYDYASTRTLTARSPLPFLVSSSTSKLTF